MNNYVEKALRTESLISEISINSRVLHAVMGINTESIELLANIEMDKINYLEELGDVCWYLAILTNSLNYNFDEMVEHSKGVLENLNTETPVHDFINNLIINAGELLDQTKRKIFYKKEFNDSTFLNLTQTVFTNVYAIAKLLNIDFNHILEKNIAKLTARYPDKYSDELAINRDVENEYKTLES